jgi:arginase family enzyme
MLRERREEADVWYLHIDLDVAGPEELPGALTPSPLWPPGAHLFVAAAAAAAELPIRVLALAAYNPNGDPERRGARLAIDLALAALDATEPSP